jgi:hypothetical protein
MHLPATARWDNAGVEPNEEVTLLPPPGPAVWRRGFSFSFGSVRTAILDTDYVINQLAERVRYGAGHPFSSLPVGGARTFAAEHVLEELYQPDALGNRDKFDKLAGQSAQQGWPTPSRVFREAFETKYLEDITFVDVTSLFEDDRPVERVRGHGADDAPTAQLAVLLSRTSPLVYSQDHALFDAGLAPQSPHFQAVVTAGRQIEPADASPQGVSYLGAGAVWAVDGAARRAAGVLRVPDWVTRLAVAGGMVWLLVDQGRRAKVMKALTPVGKFLERQMEEAASGLALLAGSATHVAADERVECRIAEMFARRPDDSSLLATEIHDELAAAAAHVGQAPTLNEVRCALTTASCFVEAPRQRYRLGCKYESLAADPG